MVRECRPPAREPARSWLARRSTMATSTLASANSPANISPDGPPPAITTPYSVIGTLPLAAVPARPLTTTDTLHASYFCRFWLLPAIMRHDPGLTASPRARDI